jgi:hypothetical protein
MKSLHYDKILKQVVNRLWDTLPDRERQIIAGDWAVNGEQTELSKWFSRVVTSETLAKYEDEEYWQNDWDSFKYAQFEQSVLQ